MKRLLIISSITIYLFACGSGDDSKTETSVTDSSAVDSSQAVTQLATNYCASGDSSQMAYWEIDTATANAMIRNLQGNGRGSTSGIRYRRNNIVQQIKDSFKTNFMGFIPARYRTEDAGRYQSARCINPTDSAGMVAQYFTNLVKVRKPNNASTGGDPVFVYFDLVTICPPPEMNCPTPTLTKSSK